MPTNHLKEIFKQQVISSFEFVEEGLFECHGHHLNSVNGLIRIASVPVKSFSLRVTSVKPF